MSLPAHLKNLSPEAQQKLEKTPIWDDPQPMLAILGTLPVKDEDWLFEVKWDGYRGLAVCMNDTIRLTSRNGNSLEYFEPIVSALRSLNLQAILDGEIIVPDSSGRSDFQELQSWKKKKTAPLQFMIFDILWFQGYDTRKIPLFQRKSLLHKMLPENPLVRYSDHIPHEGQRFFEAAEEAGLEGIIGKKANSIYEEGRRSRNWIKYKSRKRLEAVIVGFTKGRAGQKYFGALLLAEYQKGDLKYLGHTGSGLANRDAAALHEKMKPFITNHCPLSQVPQTNMPATWIRPALVATIEYQERTKEGLLRTPVFKGLADQTLENLKDDGKFRHQKNTDR